MILLLRLGAKPRGPHVGCRGVSSAGEIPRMHGVSGRWLVDSDVRRGLAPLNTSHFMKEEQAKETSGESERQGAVPRSAHGNRLGHEALHMQTSCEVALAAPSGAAQVQVIFLKSALLGLQSWDKQLETLLRLFLLFKCHGRGFLRDCRSPSRRRNSSSCSLRNRCLMPHRQ